MSDAQVTETEGQPGLSHEQMLSALFAQLVMQQANMALMLLGKVPHPETGQAVKDLEAARLFIDQLEMLEVKTRGNLTKEEAALLKQSLMSARLAFVEAVETPPAQSGHREEQKPPPTEPGKTAEPEKAQAGAAPTAEEHRPKFTKKY